MRHSGTIQRFTIVHILLTEVDAEKALRAELDKVAKSDTLQRYTWSGYMGSYDTQEFRVYFMTEDKFKDWQKTNVFDDVVYGSISVRGDE